MTDLEAAANAWIAGDPDPETRRELRAILDGGEVAELEERMGATLRFGTAGLRGRVEAGSNRMNRATVIRASRGLADHLLATSTDERGPVVVGRDARLSSGVFMDDAIAVLVAAGIEVRYFPDPVPTPLVAYAARRLEAVAAVVVTASHNPPADNGYKVYAANAVQIVSPTDREIASTIEAVGPAIEVARAEILGDRARPVPEDLFDVYLEEVADTLPPVTGDRSLSIVYTAMHGVGGRFVLSAFERFGFTNVHPVAAQLEPDGRFPTVAFPNPEEAGAMDRAHELAAAIDADLVLANDPDTDRLAVSLPEPDGSHVQLTGNQIGVLLAEFLLQHTDIDRPIVLNSIVSSPMLAAIAAHHHATYDQTLTGFKWIWNAALDLEHAGGGSFVFGYEEALGYSVGQTVRDKDGISAAVAFAVLAAEARGASDSEGVRRAVRQGFLVALMLGVPGTAIGWHLGSALAMTGQDPQVAVYAEHYLHAAAWSIVPYLLFVVLRSFLAALSRAGSIMVITVIAIGVNALLTYGLVFGELAMPALGVAGAGWATTITVWLMFAALAIYTFASAHFRHFRLYAGGLRVDAPVFKSILRLGAPVAGISLLESGMFVAAAIFMGVLGASWLAANQIMFNVLATGFVIALAVGEACGVRVAHGVGSGSPRDVRAAAMTGVGLGIVIMMISVSVLWLFPRQIVSVFLDVGDTGNADVVAYAVVLAGIAAVFQLFDGIQVTAIGALRGLGDTRSALYWNFIGYWLIALPLGYLLCFRYGYGALGLWIGFCAGLMVCGVALAYRWNSASSVA